MVPVRTVEVPDAEVITTAKLWPAGWVGVLVLDVTPGLDGFVALGLTRGQPVEVVVAGDVVVAIVAAAAIPLDNTAPFLGPAPLSLGTKAEAAREARGGVSTARTNKCRTQGSIVMSGVLMKQPPMHLSK